MLFGPAFDYIFSACHLTEMGVADWAVSDTVLNIASCFLLL